MNDVSAVIYFNRLKNNLHSRRKDERVESGKKTGLLKMKVPYFEIKTQVLTFQKTSLYFIGQGWNPFGMAVLFFVIALKK